MADRGERLSGRQWALLAALLGVAAAVYLLPAGARQLWSQDEARMALLGEDTLRHGPRLPARVREQPYLNKPPLFFWAVALAGWPVGGVSDRVAPIPTVAASLATLLGAFSLGRRLSGVHTGFVALVVLGTTPGFFLHSHVVLPDMMFAAWLTWALCFLVSALGATPPRTVHLLGFYLCVAGALWTKGLPALMVIPAAVAAVVVSAGARSLRRLRPGAGLMLVALAVIPWAIPYARTPGAGRGQAIGAGASLIWYLDRYRHLSSIPFGDGSVVFLPWALWLVAVAVWWRLEPDRAAYRPVMGWMLVLLFLLALSVQQRSRYLLPVYPILAVLVAASVTGVSSRARRLVRLNALILIVLGAAGLVAGAWLLLAPPFPAETPPAAFVPDGRAARALLAGLGVAGPALALRALRRGGPPSRAVCWIAGALALGLLVQARTYPERLAVQYPVRAFAERARALDRGVPLFAHPDANLSFDLYLDRSITELPARPAVASLLAGPAASGLLLREADWGRWRETAHASWCPLARAAIGSRAFVLVGTCR